jgi:hypothetical protein
MTNTLTVNVTLHRLGFFGTLVRLPRLFSRHYRTMRRSNGRIVSACGAWLLTGCVLSIK